MGYEADYLQDIKERFVEFPTRPAIGFVGQMYYGYYPAIKNLIEALRVLEREGNEYFCSQIVLDIFPIRCRNVSFASNVVIFSAILVES